MFLRILLPNAAYSVRLFRSTTTPELKLRTALIPLLLTACGSAPADPFWHGSVPIEVARGRAERGPWQMNASNFDYVDDASVAITDDGHIGVAWVDQVKRAVLFQVYKPKGVPVFRQPTTLPSAAGIFRWLPRVKISADGRRVFMLWQEIVFSGGNHGGEIFFARSDDGGSTFSEPINLSNSMAGDGKGRLTREIWDNGSFDLALGARGQAYAAWTEYEGRLWLSRSSNLGATFEEPIFIAGDDERPARAPALIVDKAGDVHLAWSQRTAAKAHIMLASSRDEGRSFGAVQRLTVEGHSDAPAVAADSTGKLHVLFAHRSGAADAPHSIRYIRQVGHQRWTPAVTISGHDGGLREARFPDLVIDRADRLYATWALSLPGRSPVGIAFSRSIDRGDSFSSAEVVPGSDNVKLGRTGSLQGGLTNGLAVNASGSVALVGSTIRLGVSSHIWLWRRPLRRR